MRESSDVTNMRSALFSSVGQRGQTDETRKADAISKSFVKLFSAEFLMRRELYHKSSGGQ